MHDGTKAVSWVREAPIEQERGHEGTGLGMSKQCYKVSLSLKHVFKFATLSIYINVMSYCQVQDKSNHTEYKATSNTMELNIFMNTIATCLLLFLHIIPARTQNSMS